MSNFVSRGSWKICMKSMSIHMVVLAGWLNLQHVNFGVEVLLGPVSAKKERIQDFNYIMFSYWVRALTHISGETLKSREKLPASGGGLLTALLLSYALTPVVYKTLSAFSRLFVGFTEIQQLYLFFTGKPSDCATEHKVTPSTVQKAYK